MFGQIGLTGRKVRGHFGQKCPKFEIFVRTKKGHFGKFWDQTFMGIIRGPALIHKFMGIIRGPQLLDGYGYSRCTVMYGRRNVCLNYLMTEKATSCRRFLCLKHKNPTRSPCYASVMALKWDFQWFSSNLI